MTKNAWQGFYNLFQTLHFISFISTMSFIHEHNEFNRHSLTMPGYNPSNNRAYLISTPSLHPNTPADSLPLPVEQISMSPCITEGLAIHEQEGKGSTVFFL